ncbi:MAG TPA: saccharopine dehydrogenase C-terminal domain-containing protein [Ramlibacter sp.]|nr:saccharopine dehydrogenase C-terminal domain-containing protein [Ramlibacter sp.]
MGSSRVIAARRANFAGRVVILGFGSVGRGVLPLLGAVLGVHAERITIVAPDAQASGAAAEFGARVIRQGIFPGNLESVLAPLLGPGDFLLNASLHVSSLDLIRFCRTRGAFYLDTCTEPWLNHYDNALLTVSQRSNYALREAALAWGRENGPGPTAILTQGANPGLVSQFVKQALTEMAQGTGVRPSEDWGRLAQSLGVKVIHIAERDTQTPTRRKAAGEFVNTWSVEAFVDEGLQPAELGWGTHEKDLPDDGARHASGCDAAIYLERPGLATRVRSWTPLQGSYHGFLVTHAESISIADHLTVREDGRVVYRPTVNYAYHPCDDAVLSVHELAGRNWKLQDKQRIARDEIASGIDELGVLVMGNPRGAFWYGSRLSIQEAREIAPYNSATSMQVVAGILGGMAWALRNPKAGVVEPDDIDHELVLDIARPFLGEVTGVWGDWTPLRGRSALYDEDKDAADPWQFVNFRVD